MQETKIRRMMRAHGEEKIMAKIHGNDETREALLMARTLRYDWSKFG